MLNTILAVLKQGSTQTGLASLLMIAASVIASAPQGAAGWLTAIAGAISSGAAIVVQPAAPKS